MKDFFHQYCEKNKKRINPAIFDRSFDKPLYEYIVDTCKNLEVLPPITFLGYELITDQTKIDLYVNKNNSKDSKIRNNRALEKLIPSKPSICDMLILKFKISLRGREEYVTRKMLVFKELPGCTYYIRGKRVTPLVQVVDNSTYVKNNSLKFKTTLVPIDLGTELKELLFTNGTRFKCPVFKLDLFSKIANPLLYFFAKFDFAEVIEMFKLDKVISVVSRPVDEDRCHYVKITNDVYVEVIKEAIGAHEFILPFTATLVDALSGDRSINMKSIYSTDYWTERLAEIFGKKTLDKGEKVLISFAKIMDPTTIKKLAIKDQHKRNTHTVVRWMMTNYTELLKKDNHNLENKRIRVNECIAHYFDAYTTRNVNSLLNNDSAPLSRYIKLLNAISEFTLFKAIGGSNPYNLFRYERYNDFEAINISRYTMKGPTGINGTKNRVANQYRDIYPSQLGRFDLNVCSSSPGLTGFLTINAQIDKVGRFGTHLAEPDMYDKEIKKALAEIDTDWYKESREKMSNDDRLRNEDGFIVLERKLTNDEVNHMFQQNPGAHGMYRIGGELRFIPNTDPRNAKGFIELVHNDEMMDPNDKMSRDKNGFIIFEEARPLKRWDKYGNKVDFPPDFGKKTT